MQRPKLTREFVAAFLKEVIPEYEAILASIEKNGSNFKLPAETIEMLTRLNALDYPVLYRGEDTLNKALFLAFLPADEINAINAEINKLPDDKKSAGIEELASAIAEAANSILENYPDTPEKQELARKHFDEMTPDERTQAVKQAQLLVASFMASFYNALSMMVHGQSLPSLVNRAESGDDDAFLLAVHIDRQILKYLPYFKERHERAIMDGEFIFLGRLNYRLSSPLLKGRIRHKTLWLAFAVMDGCGLLDGSLKHREILDICESSGVGGYENRIEDVNYLTKRLGEYRDYQKLNQRSMH